MKGNPAKTAMVASAAVAAGAGSYVLYQNRRSISLAIWRWHLKRCVDDTARLIQVVNDLPSWHAIEKELLRSSYAVGCVGFDCEWVTGSGTRRPVALLQLATYSGLCVLVRLCHLTSPPQKLLEMLQDPTLLKVGVAPAEDCRLLQIDHDIVVNGALDLRVFFSKLPSETKQTKNAKKKQNRDKQKIMYNSEATAENFPCGNETNNNASMLSVEVLNEDEFSGSDSRRKAAAEIENNSSETSLKTSSRSTTSNSPINSSSAPPHSKPKTSKHLSFDSSTLSQLCSAPASSGDSPITEASSFSTKKLSAETPSPGAETADHKVSFVGLKGPSKLGLSGLAQCYLKRTLDKDWRVRASDWEAEHLTQRQILYAAEDARSGLHVFLVIIEVIVTTHNLFEQCSVGFWTSILGWSSTTKSLISLVASQLAITSPPEHDCDADASLVLAKWAEFLERLSIDISIE